MSLVANTRSILQVMQPMMRKMLEQRASAKGLSPHNYVFQLLRTIECEQKYCQAEGLDYPKVLKERFAEHNRQLLKKLKDAEEICCEIIAQNSSAEI